MSDHIITDDQVKEITDLLPEGCDPVVEILKKILLTKGKPETIGEIPEKMRRENWFYYTKARSESPEVIIPNTRNLISNLLNGIKLTGDTSRLKDIAESIRDTQNAWYLFKEESNWGEATSLCWKVLDRIGDMMQDPKWAVISNDSFVLPSKK